MPKKSAKSKGYRKVAAKKPYLTKKEITITAVIAAVIVIGLILLNVLPSGDDSLTVKDGAVQTEGVNSLIVNTGTGYNPSYEKLGQLAEIDGYALTSAPVSTDENVRKYTYTPTAESDIDSIAVRTYSLDAETYANTAAETYTGASQFRSEGLQSTEDDGHAVNYLTFRVNPDNETQPDDVISAALEDILTSAQESAGEEITPEEQELLDLLTASQEEQETVLVQALHGYVNAGENRLIHILVRNDVEAVEEYVDDAILVDAFNQVLAALSYETK